MDEQRIKEAVMSAIERSVDAQVLASVVRECIGAERGERENETRAGTGTGTGTSQSPPAPTGGTQRLLNKIVLGDILDDSILGARPQDRTFPLRLLFSELGTLLAHDGDDEKGVHDSDLAFTLASGLNFFFRASMDAEAKIRVGLEVSRQLYTLAHDAKIDDDVLAKAAPLLATIMSTELERVRFESVDHAKVFDSQTHERTAASDPTGSRILRPASFLCRVSTNNAVKAKAQVVT